MDIPRGHAMLPLNEGDLLDFIYNYFKAEYAPIRSLWSTATAEPRQSHRWISMGHELSPLSFRPANAQAQKDLESLDFFTRKQNLDAGFVRGIVIRFAKYEVHERLEKKLYESCRLDLMVRKALKEKHLIDAIWPSPAPRNIAQDLLAQGVQARKWYGDMFAKYFRHLHAVDDFALRPEVDQRIKSSGTLMLVPFVDHLVFGNVDPIMPIVAKGAGYSNAKAWRQKEVAPFGEPDRFEIRFDAPGEIVDTHTRSVVRQCQCLKCGSKRDVTVVISIDPSPGPTGTSSTTAVTANNTQRNSERTGGRRPSNTDPNTGAIRQKAQKASKTTQRYSPGYSMPGVNDPTLPRQRQALPPQLQTQNASQDVRPPSPQQKKQCLRCTFLNHPELTSCEMCQGELPEATLVTKPPSPAQITKHQPQAQSSHSHSASLPPPTAAETQDKGKEAERPAAPNRHSLSSTLFSIFPFSQQHQSEHHANLPPTQPADVSEVSSPAQQHQPAPKQPRPHRDRPSSKPHPKSPIQEAKEPTTPREPPKTPPNLLDPPDAHEPDLSHHPEMAMMPLTPPAATSGAPRPAPFGLPSNLMDDFVPVSPSFPREEEEEDAGWGEMSREEARKEDSDEEEDMEDDEYGRGMGVVGGGGIDLDAVAREEMGVWGDRDDD